MKAEQETVQIELEGAKFLKKQTNCGVLRHGGGGGGGRKCIERFFGLINGVDNVNITP